jgi:amidase
VYDDLPAGIGQAAALYNTLSEGDGGAWVRRLLQRAGTTVIHPRLQQRLEDATPLSLGDFTAVLEEVDRCRSAMLTFLHSYDVILCPVCAFPAPPHGTATLSIVSYTEVYNLTGWPGGMVRGGTLSEGLPIGVQVVARPWREDVALAVA